MSMYMKKLLTTMLFAISAAALSSCGGDQVGLTGTAETSLICKAPETLTDDGTACELIIVPCNYPEVPNELGLCEMDTGAWPDGTNGITMPEPEYIPKDDEIVLYYALKEGEYTGWGLHAFNEGLCTSWAMFDGPGGETTGTSWGIPIDPVGVDPNFGVYWVMDITDNRNCGNWIPYNFDASLQVQFTAIAQLADETVNPTNRFFLLEGLDLVFPHPRTFDSLVVPGGSTLICEDPQVLNETGDACIDDPTALVTFVPGEATLYLKGSFNDWTTNEDYVFEYADGVYTMVASLAAAAEDYNFKIADDLWSEPTSFGATATEEPVVLGEDKTLVVGEDVGQNITLTVSADANYQFIFDATDPELPVLTVIEVPLKRVMYVKGTLNEWSNSQAMVYEGDNIYSSVFTLEATDYEFKVADANWIDDTNFGATLGDEMIDLDTPKSLVFGEGVAQNITLTITEAGNYKFVLDATSTEAPLLTVSTAVPYGNNELYLKGTMNDWSQVEGFGFAYADNHYTLATLLEPATHEFKIAPDDWNDAASIGGLPDNALITLDEALTVAVKDDGGSENLRFVVDASAMYQFDIDATDKHAPVLLVSEYTPFVARTMMLKGTMNDWSNDVAYEFTYAAGIFTLETTVDAATHEFKIASADWEDDSTIGGLPDMNLVTVAEPLTVAIKDDGGTENIRLVVDAQTTYIFTVDATIVGAPVLTVTVKE
jgi:hypothetical protein